ncbi:MAG: hypothetical protein ACPL7A_02710, partial [Anaerolineales bacterium]
MIWQIRDTKMNLLRMVFTISHRIAVIQLDRDGYSIPLRFGIVWIALQIEILLQSECFDKLFYLL